MRKTIDLNVSLTPSQCGCRDDAGQTSEAHPAGTEHACCGDGNGVKDVAHQHEEGCCGAHVRPAATGDRDGILHEAEGGAR